MSNWPDRDKWARASMAPMVLALAVYGGGLLAIITRRAYMHWPLFSAGLVVFYIWGLLVMALSIYCILIIRKARRESK